jgi:Starch-binding associating with outer membrane
MMNRSLLAVSSGLALAIGVVACNSDKLTALNKNPNSPEDVSAATLFTAGTVTAVDAWLGGGYDLRGAEFVVQHLAEVQYPDEDRYARLTGGSTAPYFDDPYVGPLEDFQKVISKGTAVQEAGVYGPALVMRTWVFGYLTDTWGDIPYFDALKGDSAGGSLAPKYDQQKLIYDDFFKVLDQASKDMSASSVAGNIGSADPVYGGNLKAWQKFANSLRARYALRLINVDPTTASAQMTAALAAPGGLITSNSDNAQLKWPGDGLYDNPWADNFKTRDDHRMSIVLMNLMKANNDPRIPTYAQPNQDDGTYTGAPNALLASDITAYLTGASRPGVVLYPGATVYGTYGCCGASFPSFMLTAAEVNFTLAEAAQRGIGGLTPAQAPAFYIAGITASMEQWGVTDQAAIASYLAQPGVAYAGGTPSLVQIADQKYIALFTDGGQAWAEWRRTCQPATIQPGPAAIRANVPRRFMYSITEVSVNGANVDAAIADQGADTFETRMYWDSKPQNSPTWFAACGIRGQAPAP